MTENIKVEKTEFESFLESQPKEIQEKYETHVKGLKTALQSERDAHQTFERQLREVTGKLEATSQTRQELERLTQERDAKINFFNKAHELGISDLELAFLAANSAKLISDSGPDFTKLKELHPQLFTTKVVTSGDAGKGRESVVRETSNSIINTRLRNAAKNSNIK